MSKRDLLWEIGTEEIPARFMSPALAQLKELAAAALGERRLAYEDIRVYGSPRRLALLVFGLDEKQADEETEVKGPSQKAAFDADGNPTRALQGFCKGQGVEPADVFCRELNGQPYVFVKKKLLGQPALEVLPAMLIEISQKLYFPKPMRWGEQTLRFARPIRWLLALWGQDVLPVEWGGVKAGRTSRGHRFLGSDQVEVASPADYVETMRAAFVMVDQEERKAECWRQIQAAAASVDGVVRPDEELLEEVCYLLEYPTALVGSFSEEYLALPEPLVITPMREHQRYFPVFAPEGGLRNRFVTVRNGNSEHLDVVAAGNEKVLKARLDDAAFFLHEDLKHPLADNLPRLSGIVFHESLGRMDAKVERIRQIAAWIGKTLSYSESELADLDRAALLCKADLVSHAVYEFTELQGIMGEYYARASQETDAVATAIREHYLPRGAGDELPATKVGAALAIADKIDSLVSFLALDMQPSGSQDPYALRRQALGICHIIIRHQLPLSLRALVGQSYDATAAKNELVFDKEKTVALALAFFEQRMQNILSLDGYSYDVINAVLAEGVDRLPELPAKAKALAEFRTDADFAAMLAGYRRAANLVAKNGSQGPVQAEYLQEAAEKELAAQVSAAAEQVKSLAESGRYVELLRLVSKLGPAIDAFFDAVMVMTDDAALRNNRLALLQSIVDMAEEVGDLSRLVEQ